MRETHLVTYITNKLIIKIRGINEIYTLSHGSYKRDNYPPRILLFWNTGTFCRRLFHLVELILEIFDNIFLVGFDLLRGKRRLVFRALLNQRVPLCIAFYPHIASISRVNDRCCPLCWRP